MIKSQKGFGHLVIIIAVLIVGVISVAGYLVYKNDDKKSASTSKSTAVTTTQTAETVADPTADWTAYSNTKGVFSLKYPKEWVTATNPELCTDTLLLLGPDSDSVGKCASEYIGQIYISSSDGNSIEDQKLQSSLYTGITTESVTVSGVAGQKQTGTSKMSSNSEDAIGSLPDGTKNITYYFYTGGKTYIAQYLQRPTASDVSDDFELMVTKTLKFSVQ